MHGKIKCVVTALFATTVLGAHVVAQERPARQSDTVVVLEAAPIFVMPNATLTPLRIAKEGSILRLLGTDGDWFHIQFNDPQFGLRVGFVEKKYARVSGADTPRGLPEDLTIRDRPPPDQSDSTGGSFDTPPRLDSSQPPRGQMKQSRPFERGWIDVNIGAASAAGDTFSMTGSRTLFQERATFGATYSIPPGADFDFGGGVMLTPEVGVGINFSGTAHRDVASVSAQIPHPTIFNALGSDTRPTQGQLARAEGAANIQVVIIGVSTDRVRIRFFGGPTSFRVTQDAISNIRYDQTFLILSRVNNISITSFETREIEAEAWGFHLGGDVSTFFSRVVGVGGFIRFSRGTVSLENTIATALGQSVKIDVKVGGLQVGGGLRLKF